MADTSFDRPRRFYTTAAPVAHEGGFAVALDGRLARTPAGDRMVLPTHALAALLSAEWAAQGEVIDAAAMPANRLAFTALDRAAQARDGLAAEVARYAASDTLCYFAEALTRLVEREVAHWSPVLDWARDTLGLDFVRASGVVHKAQPPETLARVRSLAAELDDFSLTGLTFAAGLFGSAILAFAVQRAMLTGDAAFDLSRLDQAFQEEQWGVDFEAADKTEAERRDAQRLQAWFEALREA